MNKENDEKIHKHVESDCFTVSTLFESNTQCTNVIFILNLELDNILSPLYPHWMCILAASSEQKISYKTVHSTNNGEKNSKRKILHTLVYNRYFNIDSRFFCKKSQFYHAQNRHKYRADIFRYYRGGGNIVISRNVGDKSPIFVTLVQSTSRATLN